MDIISVYIGSKIQELREKKGITQCELARVIRRTRVTIINMEAGRQSTPIINLYLISKALNVSFVELLPTNLWFEENKNKIVRKKVSFEIICSICGQEKCICKTPLI